MSAPLTVENEKSPNRSLILSSLTSPAAALFLLTYEKETEFIVALQGTDIPKPHTPIREVDLPGSKSVKLNISTPAPSGAPVTSGMLVHMAVLARPESPDSEAKFD